MYTAKDRDNGDLKDLRFCLVAFFFEHVNMKLVVFGFNLMSMQVRRNSHYMNQGRHLFVQL